MKSTVNCLLDWFKFSINKKFDFNDPSLVRLFSVLKLDIDVFDDQGETVQFGRRFFYDQNTVVLAFPRDDKNVARIGVADYFFVDMSGNACRDFEMRGGNWRDLFEEIASFSYHFTRIDVSIDDFGVMSLEGLQKKIDAREYVSEFRGTAKVRYVPILPDDLESFDNPVVFRKQQSVTRRSWSATFGTKQTVELQFYDKSAEREANGISVSVSQWIRCEMRFRDKKADPCFIECLKSLRAGEFNIFAMSCLVGLIDFKELKDDVRSKIDQNTLFSYPRWQPYQNFIGNVNALKIYFKPKFIEEGYMLRHMRDWAAVSVANTLSMMMIADPVNFHSNVDGFVAKYVSDDKFKNRQVAIVNAWNKKMKKGPMTFDEVMAFFKDNLGVTPISRHKKGED